MNCTILHSRPQRPRSFWSTPRIATSGQVQRHSGFEWICQHNRLRPKPIRLVRLDSEHAQSDGKSVYRGLPLLDTARGRDSWCWPKGARPVGTRLHNTRKKHMDENGDNVIRPWRIFFCGGPSGCPQKDTYRKLDFLHYPISDAFCRAQWINSRL